MSIKVQGNGIAVGTNPLSGYGEIVSSGQHYASGSVGYDPAQILLELQLMGLDRESFDRLPASKQRKIVKKIQSKLRPLDHRARAGQFVINEPGSKPQEGPMARDRAQSGYYQKLREWINRPLVLERPQGSSLHHIMDYDNKYHQGVGLIKQAHEEIRWDELQSLVVEHDWARATVNADDTGEWRLPFEFCCFEFRISGARVLAFMVQDDSSAVIHMPIMALGIADHWSCSQHEYVIRGASITPKNGRNTVPGQTYVSSELFPLAQMVARQVRAISIMLDAQVTETETRPPGPGINRARERQGRVTVRPHYVVRLLRRQRRYEQRAGAGAPTGRRVGFHFRRGHYRHFQDMDSGEIKYVNEGGFWLSKTWVNWMSVGDPDFGIVEKEYRL